MLNDIKYVIGLKIEKDCYVLLDIFWFFREMENLFKIYPARICVLTHLILL